MTETSSQRYAFFDGQFVPLEEAKVSVMTHAFNYGTGVFEGIRAFWNQENEQLYLMLVREHFERFKKNCKMVFIEVPYSVDQLVDMAVRLIDLNPFRQDVYLRPIAYKASEQIGVKMDGVADAFTMFVAEMTHYVPLDRGLSVCVSSWRRTSDNAIPGRAKLTGDYINSALAKNEANRNGYDEAVVLNELGYVCEASAANIFLVRDGTLVTPSVADGILEGYTRDAIITLAREELGIRTVERPVARTELYYADEIFLTGTGVHVAPITDVDGRPVGDGSIGSIAASLQRLYFDVASGKVPKYMDWLTPVLAPKRAEVAISS